MALHLVLGPANSAKAGHVLTAYGDAAPRKPVLVVPTVDDAAHYTRELAARKQIIGGSVLTFAGLAREIARRAGYGQQTLSALQRERLVGRATAHAQLEILTASARGPGFVRAACALIAELERSLITPQRFAKAAQGDPYTSEIAAIYRGYARELERLGRVDAELFAWRALDALRAAPHQWGQAPVFFYGFDDLFALERDAIETLARIVGVEVTVSLTYESGRRALAARAEAAEELRQLATTVTELPAADDYYEPVARRALHHLERHLFESARPERPERPERVDAGGAVKLLEAGGERAEAELVAAEILELTEEGIPAEEIAVVHRSLETSAPLFERVLAAAGIEVAVKRQLPFAHAALGRSLLALARCALLPDTSANDLITYLRAPGLLERPEVADALEHDVRREALHTAAQAREKLGWRLAEIDAVRTSSEPLAELERQARRLLAAPHRAQAAILDAREELDARALRALHTALADLAELGERPSGRELIELLEGLSIAIIAPERSGAVLLTEPLAIRARRFRVVFVCGLQEGAFPLPGAPEPFLPDVRRRELAASSGLRLRLREDALARERYLLYACTSRPTELLRLSYRSSDEEGNLALPSPFIADVQELLAEELITRKRLLADVVWPEPEAPTERERARARAASRAPQTAAETPDQPGQRLSEQALTHVRHAEVLSAGGLECYADCPVKWLVEKELQPARFEPDPDPITRGKYMHDVLERLLRRLGTAVTAERLTDAARILDEILAEPEIAPSVASGSSPAVREATLKTIRADLRRYLDQEAAMGSGWGQAGLELRFGFEEDDSLPALELAPDLRLRGVIDRVDVNGSGQAIVRDYKTGKTNASHRGDRWSEDRQLQVALYMLAVRELLGLEPVAGFYQQLGGEDLRPRGVYLEGAEVGGALFRNDGRGADELGAELRDAADLAVDLARRLRAGELTPSPETCTREGCAYPGICRVGQ